MDDADESVSESVVSVKTGKECCEYELGIFRYEKNEEDA